MLQNALSEAECKPDDINKIILAGGSSNIPLIRYEIQKFLGQKAETVGNPAKLVGKGAGIYCGSLLTGSLNYDIITPISSVSYDIGLKMGNQFIPFIQPNTEYGIFSDIRYFTVKADSEIIINVCQHKLSHIRQPLLSPVGTIRTGRLHLPENVIGIQLGTDINGNVLYTLYKKNEDEPFISGRL